MIAWPPLWLLMCVLVFAAAPTPSFKTIIISAAAALVAQIVTMITAIVMTWRRSASNTASPPWWTRWYVLVCIFLSVVVVDNLLVELAHRFYKPFYMPGESMVPTLAMYDKIVADMRAGRRPATGDVVLIRSGAVIYVKRVVGLPGQRVSMLNDVPSINGARASVQDAGPARFLTSSGSVVGRRFHEKLPGTTKAHDIMIDAATSYGDLAEVTVPLDTVFVLGDNRERSVDSRLSVDDHGLGMVPIKNIVGQPLYVTWSADRSKIGRPAGF